LVTAGTIAIAYLPVMPYCDIETASRNITLYIITFKCMVWDCVLNFVYFPLHYLSLFRLFICFFKNLHIFISSSKLKKKAVAGKNIKRTNIGCTIYKKLNITQIIKNRV
jgi:hypothetical protein